MFQSLGIAKQQKQQQGMKTRAEKTPQSSSEFKGTSTVCTRRNTENCRAIRRCFKHRKVLSPLKPSQFLGPSSPSLKGTAITSEVYISHVNYIMSVNQYAYANLEHITILRARAWNALQAEWTVQMTQVKPCRQHQREQEHIRYYLHFPLNTDFRLQRPCVFWPSALTVCWPHLSQVITNYLTLRGFTNPLLEAGNKMSQKQPVVS